MVFRFHGCKPWSILSPIEVSRIIATGIDKAQEARDDLACILSKYGYIGEVPNPDIATKAKAQALIGLGMTNSDPKNKHF